MGPPSAGPPFGFRPRVNDGQAYWNAERPATAQGGDRPRTFARLRDQRRRGGTLHSGWASQAALTSMPPRNGRKQFAVDTPTSRWVRGRCNTVRPMMGDPGAQPMEVSA